MKDKTKTEILDKLEKLQRMQASTNPQEVENATIMMHKLMKKYQIEENQLNKIETKAMKVSQYNVHLKYSIRSWVSMLSSVIAELYECRATMNRYKRIISFVGFEPDNLICAKTFNYCYETLMRLSKENITSDSPAETNRRRNCYLYGCIMGLNETITKIIEARTPQEEGLIVLKDEEIEKELEGLNTHKTNKPQFTKDTLMGIEHGKRISLNEQVEGEKE